MAIMCDMTFSFLERVFLHGKGSSCYAHFTEIHLYFQLIKAFLKKLSPLN